MSDNRYGASFWGDKNGLDLDHGDARTHLNIRNATDTYF